MTLRWLIPLVLAAAVFGVYSTAMAGSKPSSFVPHPRNHVSVARSHHAKHGVNTVGRRSTSPTQGDYVDPASGKHYQPPLPPR